MDVVCTLQLLPIVLDYCCNFGFGFGVTGHLGIMLTTIRQIDHLALQSTLQ